MASRIVRFDPKTEKFQTWDGEAAVALVDELLYDEARNEVVFIKYLD